MFLEAFPSKSHLEFSQGKPMEIRERGGGGGGSSKSISPDCLEHIAVSHYFCHH